MSILSFFFFLLILLLVFGFSIIGSIFRFIFGGGKRQESRRAYSTSQNNESSKTYTNAQPNNNRKKIFDKDDGEYVDFEEVKEDSR